MVLPTCSGHGVNPVTELNFVGKVGSLQMANGRGWRYPEIFRRMAVERFKCCENIEWLAKELGVPRQTLSRESRLRREINDLKRLVAEKKLEVDFFKGALQRIKARRRESSGSGELASTTTSVT